MYHLFLAGPCLILEGNQQQQAESGEKAQGSGEEAVGRLT